MITDVIRFNKIYFHRDANTFKTYLACLFEVEEGKPRYVAVEVDRESQTVPLLSEEHSQFDIISRDFREHIRDQVTAFEFFREKEEEYAAPNKS